MLGSVTPTVGYASLFNRGVVAELRSILKVPKPPKTAFNLFIADKFKSSRASNQEASVSKVFALLAQQWKTLDPNDKSQYLKRAEEERAQSLAAKAVYFDNLNDRQLILMSLLHKNSRIEAGRASKKILTDEERQVLKAFPEYPPTSGYLVFMKQRMQSSLFAGKKIAETSQIVKGLASEWANLPQHEKDRYNQASKTAQQTFLSNLQAFVQSN